MRRAILVRLGLAAVACIALAWPPAASSQETEPTLTLTEACDTSPNFFFTLEGLPPNTPTMLTVHHDDQQFGSGQVFTNASGGYSFGLGLDRPATWTVTIEWVGGTLQESLHVDCSQPDEPTAKQQCKHGGWRTFPQFKSQGQCVAFVQRGPK